MKKQDAISHFGSASELARQLSRPGSWPITEAAVSQWGEVIPFGRAYQIEVLTGGQLKAVQPQPQPQPAQ